MLAPESQSRLPMYPSVSLYTTDYHQTNLDEEGELCFSAKHSIDHHSCHFACDDILRNSERDFSIDVRREEVQQVMIDAI